MLAATALSKATAPVITRLQVKILDLLSSDPLTVNCHIPLQKAARFFID